ncbi:glycoside hydrolase family 88 protein [Pseudalkalibacillus hwajinpoensis]|uniref:glycoside hydrolase family 88 protein n=1 Tax=Guptibacillus hwajinpoensis TaxID=208199 RepID=UPI00325B3F00
MVFQYISYLLILIVFLVALLDVIPLIFDWFSRVRIGRYKDFQKWNECVTQKSIKWLSKTPKIKVTDNTRLVIIDRLKGNYTKSSIQHWQEGTLILGLMENYKISKDDKIKKAILQYMNVKFNSDGQWRESPTHVDSAILAYAIMKIDFIDTDKYKQALEYVWNMIQEHIGKDGTVKYRKSMDEYRYVDTIGFICPFLIAFGVRYKEEKCIDLAVKQIQEFNKYGMLNKYFIPCHAYHIKSKVPLGLYGWGRGLGWYAIGLIDSWNELPNNNKYKAILRTNVISFTSSAIAFQQGNGSWNWTVSRNESRPDSSVTAVLAWFMINAASIEGLTDKCIASEKLATSYLMSVTRRSGAIDFSQGDTKDIGMYSRLFNILPFTQGFSLRVINKHISSECTLNINHYKEFF